MAGELAGLLTVRVYGQSCKLHRARGYKERLHEHPPSRVRTRQTSVSARRRRVASSDAAAGGSSASTALRRLSATSRSIPGRVVRRLLWARGERARSTQQQWKKQSPVRICWCVRVRQLAEKAPHFGLSALPQPLARARQLPVAHVGAGASAHHSPRVVRGARSVGAWGLRDGGAEGWSVLAWCDHDTLSRGGAWAVDA